MCVGMRGPLRVARFIGYGRADELGPVAAREETRAIDALAGLPYAVLLADRLPDEWAGRLGGTELRRDSSPVIDIAGLDWDGYLASRSSNFRSQVRRKERKLVSESGLTYRLSESRESVDRDMETLFSLHAARWGEGSSGALTGMHAGFHREFAQVARERGWLRLWVAEAGERPIAAWYGFRFGGAEWYYQFGRDPEWERSSIGLVLLAHTLREAIADGQREYKLLRGGESYKERFATSKPDVVSVGVGRGPVGKAAVAGGAGVLELRRRRRGRAKEDEDPSTTPPPSS